MPVTNAVYVVDTSYLLEYYKVGRHYREDAHREIWQRFSTAVTNRNRLYIPVPVIFELANHIAHVNDGGQRQKLAVQFVNDVQNSLSNGSPFQVVPCQDFQSIEDLLGNLQQFAAEYAGQGLGLTDTSVYLQAQQLYRDYQKFKKFTVHIWTRDKALKAREPDKEEYPFV
ncbi:PIN domain-containing protein [Methylovulum psychrotolerans]|uniref:PIN domain-containing protein n=1 Tax=Methylovulum psychrotolerans TaxID=1704499 RepID=UPI001BFF32E9|nr:PIN domain-containing protein [Methylovulum psychrotolerans]MBT9096349.1 PIN domain-containing protein [Methylovulum psychrotolerans]